MLFCSPAKEKDQSSLLYSSNWRAKLSQIPFALGTSPAHHGSLLQELTKSAYSWQFSVAGMKRTIQGVLYVVLSRSSSPEMREGGQEQPAHLSPHDLSVCVSDMGLVQMPCAPESLPPVGRPSLHPCAKPSPLWAWQRTCISLVKSLQEL